MLRNGDYKEVQIDAERRTVTWPYQVRDLMKTGFATLTRGAETEVIGGDVSRKIDVFTITGANTSDAAQRVDIRVGTAGSIVDSLVIPATSVASKTYNVPLLSPEAGQSWTARNAGTDVSDSPVTVTMVGVRNE